MIKYFWKQRDFWGDIKQEIKHNNPRKIIISSAYLSFSGVAYLKELVETSELTKEDICIYCSIDFNDSQPGTILEKLYSIAKVFLVITPFLHSKIYEFHRENKVLFYHGSANLTEGGLMQNFECMSKSIHEISPVVEFWEHIKSDSVEVTKEVVSLYQKHQATLIPKFKNKNEILESNLRNIKDKQTKIRSYPDLDGFYFNIEDYITVSKEWYKETSSVAHKRRKVIQDKLLALHQEIEPRVKKWDLHPHYNNDFITSGVNPSRFNHGRVGGIWLRYGKHKKELNPFGGVERKIRRGNKDPIEQFHKHACFQVSFTSNGIDIGIFHSTAKDGIDRIFVRDNWYEVKEKITQIYNSLIGNQFVWHFYDAKNNISRQHFEIDKGSVENFLEFYHKNDIDGLESFCMRHFKLNDTKVKTREGIINEAIQVVEVLIPLYQAMTFRIPASMR